MKKLRKSVNICQSYRKNNSDTFFMDHGVHAPWQAVSRSERADSLTFGYLSTVILRFNSGWDTVVSFACYSGISKQKCMCKPKCTYDTKLTVNSRCYWSVLYNLTIISCCEQFQCSSLIRKYSPLYSELSLLSSVLNSLLNSRSRTTRESAACSNTQRSRSCQTKSTESPHQD